MKTAKEMVEYCDAHGTGKGVTKGWRLKHFKVLEAQLSDNEEVSSAFIGMHDYESATKHKGYFAYGITKDRLIATQKKMLGEEVIVIKLSRLNDITMKNGVLMGVLIIDTKGEKIKVAIDKSSVRNVHNLITNALTIDNTSDETTDQPKETDSFEELKKSKELLDMGAITEDEYEQIKKKLLGL